MWSIAPVARVCNASLSMAARLAPPRLTTADGRPRRLGVELELGGLELATIAAIVADVFAGEVVRDTDYKYRVDAGERGVFRVEADLELLQKLGVEAEADGEAASSIRHRILAAFGELVAPCEVVGPPLPFDSLREFDMLTERLRRRGAAGTRSSLLAAYGAQLNPEAPSLEADSITRHLRAFALIYDWLFDVIDVNLSRRITPFVDAYPRDYVLEVIAGDYHPDMSQLIDDYLAANPTRNRALDMLPLFAHVDEPRVRAVVVDPRVKPRPTYHYRLPDSRVQDPGWSISAEWERWLVVEHVAADRELAATLTSEYLAVFGSVVDRVFTGGGAWAQRCDELLAPLWDG